MIDEKKLAKACATAILGIDTLWGGDVMNPSGTGRFIADSWFADEKLPLAYTHPAAAKLRASGGVGGKTIDQDSLEEYLAAVDVARAIGALGDAGRLMQGVRGAYLVGPRRLPRR